MHLDNREPRLFLGAAFLAGAAIGYKAGYGAPIAVAYEEWEIVQYEDRSAQSLISIDCGTFRYTQWDTGWVVDSSFNCRDINNTSTARTNLTSRRLIETGTVILCRRYLKGEGFCDNSGKPLANH